MKILNLAFFFLLVDAKAFQASPGRKPSTALHAIQTKGKIPSSRRCFAFSLVKAATAGAGVLFLPESALAGIDVSGLTVEGNNGNAKLAQQLKAYDGSGQRRVNEIKDLQPATKNLITPPKIDNGMNEDSTVAHWAYRANPSFKPSLSRAGPFGNLYRLNDEVVPPSGSKLRSVGVQFEFPSDWLQLDKFNGGIQYVDQRNGDKLYLLQAPLPTETSLASLSKNIIGDLIFDQQGSVVKTGQTVEEYKVVNGQTIVECPDGSCATRRRFKIKYATVTGNGLRVERRGLVDAYQVDNEIYILMTSSNAVKFEQKESQERATVENIVASFTLTL